MFTQKGQIFILLNNVPKYCNRHSTWYKYQALAVTTDCNVVIQSQFAWYYITIVLLYFTERTYVLLKITKFYPVNICKISLNII
nr:MAG TPA: hypothetical protein [Caudoviricetes sp.]DAY00745.1 MAG TPA: hypothetical protein [Caudoviricetes sp.]